MYITHYIAALIQKRFNSFLDEIVRPTILVAGHRFSFYQFWVNIGVIVGTIVIFILTFKNGVSVGIMTGIVVMVGLLSFFLFKSTKIFGKSYALLNWAKRGVYHFQIVALIFTLVFLNIMNAPVLKYLDILVIGLLIYQAVGRIGCLMAGCCHGRPHTWGICYGAKHEATRYIYFLQKVRLFPVQLLECIWLFFLAIIALKIQDGDPTTGENLSWYILGYGFGRFFFEFMRGDLERVYIVGFSEPQWTAFSLSVIVICLENWGILPLHLWHIIPAVVMALVIIALLLLKKYRAPSIHQLRQPDHVMEIFQTMNWLNEQYFTFSGDRGQGIRTGMTGTTSLGLQITLIGFLDEECNIYCYRLSQSAGELSGKSATKISKLMVLLKHRRNDYKIVDNGHGIFDLLINRSATTVV